MPGVVGKGDVACLVLCRVDGVSGLDRVIRVIRVNVVDEFRVCAIGVGMDGPGVSGNE